MILMVCFVVFMILWLFGGGYLVWDKNNPHGIGNLILPWLCVLILGLKVFGAY